MTSAAPVPVDPNWLLSTEAQSAAALVAIIGGFLVSRLVSLSSEREGLRRRRREVAGGRCQRVLQNGCRTKRVGPPSAAVAVVSALQGSWEKCIALKSTFSAATNSGAVSAWVRPLVYGTP